ncbi:MAG: trigger factor [Clostridia bacterium]|nr:trigger factor [Clostridia bacterium]
MSLKSNEKISSNTAELTFLIEKEPFDKAVTEAYKKQAAKITVPGFRKGKAPRALVEKMYGTAAFVDEAINNLLPEYYGDAVKESGIEPVGRPEFDVVEIGGEGALLKVTVAVKPDVTVKNYVGIEAEKTIREVTEEAVNDKIEQARQRNSREIDVEGRPAENGDVANIDYTGSVDGVPFDGGSAKGHDLKIGSGTFIPGFEDQIIGKNVGDEFDVNVTFPEDYHAENLKGKAAVFKVRLNSLKATELPELDDEFAKDVSEFDTLDEYKADVKKQIAEDYDKRAENDVTQKIMAALIDDDHFEADVPEEMFENEAENQVRDLDYRLRGSGLDLKTYMKYLNTDLDGLKAQYRPSAEQHVKTRLALEQIAKNENITVTDEDIDAELGRIAEAYNMDPEEVSGQVSREMVADDLKVGKASEFVRKSAKITEKPEEPAEKSEKE